MRNSSGTALSLTYPAASPFALVFGYVAVVALFRRSGLFDLTYHVIVLVLIGISFGGGSPFREIATAMVTTILAASAFAYLFGVGTRARQPAEARRLRRGTIALKRTALLGNTR
ncbi:MAG: hypothetical protein IT562_08615 [Alphaproteobacteria bacterium]|nr:hypothetical protein [Alphaproteobacteria bacterium]